MAVWGFAQATTATIKGQVTDPSGAAIPNATVTVKGEAGVARQVKTDAQGNYTVPGIAPGAYSIRVDAKGFNAFEAEGIQVAAAATTNMNVPLGVAMETQSVTVSTDSNSVSTDPSQNVGQLVLKGTDLEQLSDDPDDLASDLQALAGPAAGPNGGQIYIDGFTGGQLPPKSAIREVRINSNPFSAEYDRLGFGRIEILTKPGSDKFRGQVFANFGNKVFNSRNPFVTGEVPDYSQEFFGGNVSGPLGKKASFFFDIDRRITDENALVVAQQFDPTTFSFSPLNEAYVTPRRRTDLSPRVDYQLNSTNTLSARYRWSDSSTVGGVGNFSLPEMATLGEGQTHTVQVTETAVLGTHAVNETRFQYFGSRNNSAPVLGVSGPTISVAQGFTGGSPSFSLNGMNQNHYEGQNYTTVTRGSHQVRFGARVRGITELSQSNSNYNGMYNFGGAYVVQLDPNFSPITGTSNPAQCPGALSGYSCAMLQSTELYAMTERLLAPVAQGGAGWTPAQARLYGYGPSQFTLTAGTPMAGVDQIDYGLFVQDDWRLKPNLTVSGGLRYEWQNNIHDNTNIAPRLGIAWAPGGKGSRQPKTVIRAGGGMFYDRFGEDLVLNALWQNGVIQQQYVVSNPTFYPNVPDASTLEAFKANQAVRQVSSELRAPRIFQTAVGVDRQLPWHMSLSVNWTRSQGWNQLRSRNINAPLPGTVTPGILNSGVRPYGNIGDVYQYESSGVFEQNQLMTNIQARISPKFSLMGFYVYGKANSNTDGAGGFPANTYDLTSEWGRAGFDVHHRAFIGGNITAPYAVTFNPFIIINSGPAFNIVTGRDLNGDGIFNDRPAFATDLSRPTVVLTQWGAFDTNPLPGATIIPRNYGQGPGQFTVNMRMSRTWGFGERAGGGGNDQMMGGPGGGGGPRGGGGHGGPGGFGGFGGGMRGMMGSGGGVAGKRYTLTLSVQARNLLNHVNYASPIGNLSSPYFGQSTSLAGGFGPDNGAAGNRRIEFQVRFAF